MKTMFTIRHHPQHLHFPILTQAYCTQRVETLLNPFRVFKLRVRVDHRLIQTNHHILVFVRVFVNEYYIREDNVTVVVIVVVRYATGVMGSDMVMLSMAVSYADVGDEEEGGEEDKEAESDGDGVAEAEVCYVVMGGGGEWWWWWEVGCGGGHCGERWWSICMEDGFRRWLG
ncbi:hypothetical protein Hanom_Chr16g01496611 [Helianthus anomalus]